MMWSDSVGVSCETVCVCWWRMNIFFEKILIFSIAKRIFFLKFAQRNACLRRSLRAVVLRSVAMRYK